jgi:2-polyprenyl-3-methyl-5-hydroxy-6-metoxy-1,4-benzoquinol methylase
MSEQKKNCIDYWLDTSTFTFIGDFEGMYKNIDDPWGCQKAATSLSKQIMKEIIFQKHGHFKRIMDIGCGLGAYSNEIYKRNGLNGEMLAFDVSETAISRAKQLYPHISFHTLNILTDSIEQYGRFNLIIISDILWYILEDVEGVFHKLQTGLDNTGIVAIHQYFPYNQNYGREIINGLSGFDSFLTQKTNLVYSEKFVQHHEDGLVLLALLERRS